MDVRIPELEILLTEIEPESGRERILYQTDTREFVIEVPCDYDPALLALKLGDGSQLAVHPDRLKIRLSKQYLDRMAALIRDSH